MCDSMSTRTAKDLGANSNKHSLRTSLSSKSREFPGTTSSSLSMKLSLISAGRQRFLKSCRPHVQYRISELRQSSAYNIQKPQCSSNAIRVDRANEQWGPPYKLEGFLAKGCLRIGQWTLGEDWFLRPPLSSTTWSDVSLRNLSRRLARYGSSFWNCSIDRRDIFYSP